jgi:hypothetical protein
LARVEEEVARRRKEDPLLLIAPYSGSGSFLGAGRRSRSCLDWGLITANLTIAEKNALVGKHVPRMKRFPEPIRFLARFLGKCVLFPLKMITNPQREFNQAVLVSLKALQEGIRQLERAHQQSHADLRDRHLEAIRKTLQDLERRLDSFCDETRRKAS